jgi:hypothetical protein
MYKIINDHAAPNLKQLLFRRCSEGDSSYDLRNRGTDLVLPKPKKEFLKRSFKYNGAIHWNNLSIEAKSADSVYNLISNFHIQITLLSFLFKNFNIIKQGNQYKDTLKLYMLSFFIISNDQLSKH